MRSPRPTGRSTRTGSSRFSDTFARRPDLPRLTGAPDRRAWMTTAFVATFVAGAAVAVPILTHLGGSDTVVSVDAPVELRTTTGTPTPVPTTTATVTATPRISVATATVTITAPGGKVTVVQPGTTVTLPPTTITAPGPGVPKPATVTATTTSTATTTATVTTKVTEPGKQLAGDSAGGQQIQSLQGTTMAMKGDGSRRCIDVKDGRAGAGNDGTPLQVWDCNSASNQTWTFGDDGTLRSLGQCMDLAWGSIAENTPVQLVACNGNAAQQFRITKKNQLVNPAAEGKCVTSDGGDNGGRLFLRTCTGAGNQVWHKP